MLVLRATKKVLKYLPDCSAEVAESDTAMGDWYVNRLVIDRQPLLLIISSRSRLALIDRAKDVKNLPERLPGLIFDRLRRLEVNIEHLGCEMDAMFEVTVAPTQDRSVIGQLVDFAKALNHYLPEQWDQMSLRHAENKLANTPCNVGRSGSQTIWPKDKTHELLAQKWGGVC